MKKTAQIISRRNIRLKISVLRKETENCGLLMHLGVFLYKYIQVSIQSRRQTPESIRVETPPKEFVVVRSFGGLISEMHVLIIKALFIHLTYFSCNADELFERGAELIERDEISIKNESSSWKTLIQDHPVAILLELHISLLEKLKGILEEENDSDGGIAPTTLATFNSVGLQELSFYNDTFEFRQAFMGLKPTAQQSNISSPAMHALIDVLQKGLPQGPLLLVTASRPSDEDFVGTLIRSLTENKNQLSVLWAGDEISNDYLLLKEVASRTGGKFEYLQDESENSLRPYSDDLSGSIKFPEGQSESSGEEAPLLSRAADQRAIQRVVVPVIVEVASGSSLESKPGTPTQIQFNVKNNINVPTLFAFHARYNGIIQAVQPTQRVLQPSETITVTVNVHTSLVQNANALGTVTLFATAANTVTARSAIISLTPQTTSDNYPPKISYKYDGDCSNYKEPQNCENGHWNLQATFYDEESGILKILSEPQGLLFQNEFVAGTKSPITVQYSATCCQPNAHIWAEDLKGNYIKKSFDVFNQNLLAGEIASIVLGIMLLLFIIIAIIATFVLIRRRNQRNLIIPRARSGSR